MAIKRPSFVRHWRRLFARRKYKDHLFQAVFSNKKYLLELYNALNESNYSNVSDLTITTLEDALYMSYKNDISFILSSTLNLYEHQSTVNPNMPIRGLIYFSKLYEAYIKINGYDIYGTKKITLPNPQFVIFYNGIEKQPEESFLKLSDLYEYSEYEPVLECKARVLNINYGYNKELMDKCKRLHDYSYFVNEVNNNLDWGLNLNEAIEYAMDECIEKGILTDYLLKHKAEVFDMLLFCYDEKLHKKTIREEAREEGLAEGRAEGRAEAIGANIKKLSEKMNISVSEAMDMLDIPMEERDCYNKL